MRACDANMRAGIGGMRRCVLLVFVRAQRETLLHTHACADPPQVAVGCVHVHVCASNENEIIAHHHIPAACAPAPSTSVLSRIAVGRCLGVTTLSINVLR